MGPQQLSNRIQCVFKLTLKSVRFTNEAEMNLKWNWSSRWNWNDTGWSQCKIAFHGYLHNLKNEPKQKGSLEPWLRRPDRFAWRVFCKAVLKVKHANACDEKFEHYETQHFSSLYKKKEGKSTLWVTRKILFYFKFLWIIKYNACIHLRFFLYLSTNLFSHDVRKKNCPASQSGKEKYVRF